MSTVRVAGMSSQISESCGYYVGEYVLRDDNKVSYITHLGEDRNGVCDVGGNTSRLSAWGGSTLFIKKLPMQPIVGINTCGLVGAEVFQVKEITWDGENFVYHGEEDGKTVRKIEKLPEQPILSVGQIVAHCGADFKFQYNQKVSSITWDGKFDYKLEKVN